MNTQPSGYNFPYKRSPLHQTGSVEWWDTFVAVKYNLHMTLDQYQFSKPVPSILWTHTTCMPLVVDCHVLLDREPSMAGRQAGRGKTNPCMWDFILFGYNTVQALCPYIHVSFSSCRPLYPESCWCFVVQALHFTMVIIVHRTFPLVQLHLLMALPCYARGAYWHTACVVVIFAPSVYQYFNVSLFVHQSVCNVTRAIRWEHVRRRRHHMSIVYFSTLTAETLNLMASHEYFERTLLQSTGEWLLHI